MSVRLDEKFPSLESVALYLAKEESGENESEIQQQKNERARAGENTIALDETQIERQVTAVRSILETGTATEPVELREDVTERIENIRELQSKRALLELAVRVEDELSSNPAEHSESLRSTLVELRSSSVSSEISSKLIKEIRSRWYDAALESRLQDLRALLSKTNWPKSDLPRDSGELLNTLEESIAFELPGAFDTFKVLVEPIAERLIFNFRTSRDTARPDKPEWLFAYTMKLLEPRSHWIMQELRKVTDSPMDKILLALAPTLIKTCRKTYTIDTHFVAELIQFGNDLAAKFYCSMETIDQLLYGILDHDILQRYIASEKRSYTESLSGLLKSGSQSIDFDADVSCAKPTFIALNVRELIQQAEYLLRLDASSVIQDIHLNIICDYIEWLEAQMNLYDRAHSSLARAVGTTKESLPQDVSDIEYLGRILGSASYFKSTLEMWSKELAVARTGTEIDGYLQSLNELRSKAASRIANSLTREVQKKLKAYFRIDWRHLGTDEATTSSSSIIKSAIHDILPNMHFVNRLCPSDKSDRPRVLIPFADSLAKVIWRLIIQANVFTSSSAALLQSDIQDLWLSLGLPEIASYEKLIESTSILQSGEAAEHLALSNDEIEELLNRLVAE